jgi:hypothetical protein
MFDANSPNTITITLTETEREAIRLFRKGPMPPELAEQLTNVSAIFEADLLPFAREVKRRRQADALATSTHFAAAGIAAID